MQNIRKNWLHNHFSISKKHIRGWYRQAVFDTGIPILGTLICACPNLIIAKVKTTKKCKTRFYILLHSISAASREFLEPVYRFGMPKKWARKIEQYSTQKFLFYQKDKLISFVLSLLKLGHLTCLLLSQVWYGRRKPWRFHAKRKEKQQPEPPCAIATFYQTCNRWPFKKTWTLFIRVPEQLISVRISCLGDGGMTVIDFLLLLLSFPSRKK